LRLPLTGVRPLSRSERPRGLRPRRRVAPGRCGSVALRTRGRADRRRRNGGRAAGRRDRRQDHARRPAPGSNQLQPRLRRYPTARLAAAQVLGRSRCRRRYPRAEGKRHGANCYYAGGGLGLAIRMRLRSLRPHLGCVRIAGRRNGIVSVRFLAGRVTAAREVPPQRTFALLQSPSGPWG
jgi:hypothetical protein